MKKKTTTKIVLTVFYEIEWEDKSTRNILQKNKINKKIIYS